MKIQNLSNTPLEEIVTCLLKSFEGYFVKMPDDVDFWKSRLKAARVDFGLSFGVFDKEKLVAFILNGIDTDLQQKTAFNTGTGVLPAYRGQGLVDKMYDHAFPILKQNGVSKCKLEVITKNDRAIKVYERIGFEKKRRIKCFSGDLTAATNTDITLTETDLNDIRSLCDGTVYSWENSFAAVTLARENYKVYKVKRQQADSTAIGYVILNPATGYIAQLAATAGNWDVVFEGIKQVCTWVKINNIDENRTDLLHHLAKEGLQNTIDQYEMELPI